MKQYKYKISVIIPIYNVELYLSEAIESVINQTIGFKENIELILINDGSSDDSYKICEEYLKKYPENIKYICQENQGVSAARNNGLKYAEGEFINFLDGDDKWSLNAFEEVMKMFEENSDVNIISTRIKFFEAMTDYHPLDYKFNKNKIINIHKEPNHIQLHSATNFFRYETIKKYKYDTKIKYTEDAKLVSEVIFDNENVGILKSAEYLYRKRNANNSAVNTKIYSNEWYIETPLRCYKYIVELSKKKFGKVIPYAQYLIMYDYQFRVKEEIPSCISEDVKEKYLSITTEILKEIDDKVILNQRNLFIEYKVEIMKLKYGRDVRKDFIYSNGILKFNNNNIFDLTEKLYLNIETINYNKEEIEIRGFVNLLLDLNDYSINCVVNNKRKYNLSLVETKIYTRKVFNKEFLSNKGFCLKIPKENIKTISFELIYRKKHVVKIDMRLKLNTKLDTKKKIYYINDDKIYYYYDKKIKTKKNTLKNRIYFRLRYLKQLVIEKKYKEILTLSLAYIARKIIKKKIWLISDRPTSANDNGYAFYKYCCENKNKEIISYFVISKDSYDFEKVKSTGKYVIYNSLKYKILFLIADKVISSQADYWVYNPFDRNQDQYRHFYEFDLIFLQHGITKDDLSAWLNFYQKNFRLFITSAKEEHKSILEGDYGFDEKIVKLTGLPRYDLLQNKREKLVLIMPTWRKKLTKGYEANSGKHLYNDKFKESEYYKFYNKIINDKRIIEVMKENKYKGIFVVHPSHFPQAEDFMGNEVFKVEKETANYSELFAKGDLLVTDYSSVAFDFSYLKKPIIYTHFDKEEFFSNHIYTKGYFSYEENGFGKVTYDYENTVKEIIKNIKDDCKMDSKYQKRVDSFFEYNDKNNCKRVYDEIKKIK